MWNWQKPDWPNFSWDQRLLRKAEEQFLLGGGAVAGTVKHLGEQDRQQITIELISTEALTTSEIEGEYFDRASIQSSLRRQLGFGTDRRRVKPAEEGIAEMMTAVYSTFDKPLSHETLFAWHRMLFKGRREISGYRSSAEPMQILSGAIHAPKIHFEAPPSSRVRSEMTRFLKWFNRTAPSGNEPLPALTRSGLAHLYFESIHPFEDGNGRIGRAISEKALAQSLGRPTLTLLAATILLRRKAYYAALEAASKSNELSQWLRCFAGIAIEAQRRTLARVEFLIDKAKLLDGLRSELNQRQEKALLRILREGPEGFKGGLSAGNYATITNASTATTTRDLADLVAKGALRRSGELRHARYTAELPKRLTRAVIVDANGDLKEGREAE